MEETFHDTITVTQKDGWLILDIHEIREVRFDDTVIVQVSNDGAHWVDARDKDVVTLYEAPDLFKHEDGAIECVEYVRIKPAQDTLQ